MTRAEIEAQGGFFVREHYPFGTCETYCLPDATFRYYLWDEGKQTGSYVTWDELREHLRRYWRPAGRDDCRWFEANIR